MIDSHAHFDRFIADQAVDAVLARASDAGVDRILAIGGSAPANRNALNIARAYPDMIRAAIGYDRDQARRQPDFDDFEALLKDSAVIAIGESGLDYHYHADTAAAQCRLFERMLQTAADRHLPIVIHSREADDDTLSLLRDYASACGGRAYGVLHCFTGTADFADALLALGLYISFSGIVTFKRADNVRAAAAIVPDDRLLVETDSPYLSPEPYRGKANEPARVIEVVKCLAEIRRSDYRHIQAITTRNAEQLFDWPCRGNPVQ